MKNKVLSMLVLLMMAATGAVAQTTYKVSVKEGYEGASNWQGKAGEGAYKSLPLEGVAAGRAVSVKYNGTKRVKSVKAVNPAAIPMTIEALVGGSTITVSNPKSGMQYSTDGGITKTAVSGGDITLEKAGDKVQFYGNSTNIAAYGGTSGGTKIGGSGSLKVYGNIMSLVDENNFATNTTLTANSTFSYLFQGNTSLTDASGLLLPATMLKPYCYQSMFRGCTSLVAGPNLPATTLQSNCYNSMFEGCKSLVAGPNLPATKLEPYCYYSMFRDCESLTSLTCLTTNISFSSCIGFWLDGVMTEGTLYVDESMKDKDWGKPRDWTVKSVAEKP